MNDDVTLRPIARVVGGRVEAIDDDWGDVEASIVLDDRFSEDAIAGIDDSSHIEVIFVFHLVTDDKIQSGARRPRGRDDWPMVGVFAQRTRRDRTASAPRRAGSSASRVGCCTCKASTPSTARPCSTSNRT